MSFMITEYRDCPLCGKNEVDRIIQIEKNNIVRCLDCNMLFADITKALGSVCFLIHLRILLGCSPALR